MIPTMMTRPTRAKAMTSSLRHIGRLPVAAETSALPWASAWGFPSTPRSGRRRRSTQRQCRRRRRSRRNARRARATDAQPVAGPADRRSRGLRRPRDILVVNVRDGPCTTNQRPLNSSKRAMFPTRISTKSSAYMPGTSSGIWVASFIDEADDESEDEGANDDDRSTTHGVSTLRRREGLSRSGQVNCLRASPSRALSSASTACLSPRLSRCPARPRRPSQPLNSILLR